VIKKQQSILNKTSASQEKQTGVKTQQNRFVCKFRCKAV